MIIRTITAIAYTVRCSEPDQLHLALEIARQKTSLDSTIEDVERTYPFGIEKKAIRTYSFGDYFENIQVLANPSDDSSSFRIIFQPRENTGKYWKDLMVSVLHSIRESATAISISTASRSS